MSFDFFADDDAKDNPEAYAMDDMVASEDVPPAAENDLRKVRVTLKGGSSYAAPWVTMDGVDAKDALAQLAHPDTPALLERAAKAGKWFAERAEGKPTPATSSAPQSATQGQEQGPSCVHGPRVHKQGVSKKTGKPYSGLFCPSTDRDNQCSPIFQ